MNEKKNVMTASAEAAMLPCESASALSGDLYKIEDMVSRAALIYSGDEISGENSIVSQFDGVMGTEGCPLREDKPADGGGCGIISQSKRKSGVYTSVPRIV